MEEINKSIMYLYKAYLIDKKNNDFIPDKKSLKKGILIDSRSKKEIKDLAIDLWGKDGYILNQTFHKSLDKVIKSSTEELVIEQIEHYMTTYGFEAMGIFQNDYVYIPNEKLEIPEITEDIKLVNITQLTKEQLKEKLWNLITSSIPLSKTTIEYILNLSDFLEITENNIYDIKNREVKIAFYDKLNIIPKDNVEFMRYFIFKLTKKTLLIKDKETIQLLEKSDKNEAINLLETYNKLYNLNPLSEIFNRYKPLFLALKTKNFSELNKIINKISKLSKTNHKPFKSNDLDNFINWYKKEYKNKTFIDNLKEKLKKENIWRIIKLRNYINLINSGKDERIYKIRNGKTWITKKHQNIIFNNEILNILDNIIIEKLKPNVLGKKIYLKENENIVMPQSEKQFIGNIPFSTSIKINKEDALVGIHWYNINEKRVDLDLKIISNDYSIGWDTNYKEGDKLIFTGDVTNAPYPTGASEYIYINKAIEETTFSLKVNNYTQNIDDIEYDIIIAKKTQDQLTQNYIVNPNDIIIKIPKNKIEKDKYEHSLGIIIIKNDSIELIFTDLTTSKKRTSSNSETEEIVRNYLNNENATKCKFKDYLEKAGAIITNNKDECNIDLSLININKNSIIELLK